jgi:hypothetical protein
MQRTMQHNARHQPSARTMKQASELTMRAARFAVGCMALLGGDSSRQLPFDRKPAVRKGHADMCEREA